MYANNNDPYAAADRAARTMYFGKVECTAQFVVLEKGVGKRAYVEGKDDPDQRRTELAIVVNPIDQMGLRFNVERNIIAESREWSRTVWPSLRDLGMKSARELNGAWVRCELVETDRKWIDRRGTERVQTTLRFTALYGSQAECEAAFAAEGGASRASSNGAASNGGNGASSNGTNDRAAALAFVETLVQQTKGDRNLLAQLIAGMPMINAHFTVDSPEVVALLEKAGA